jgi:anti-anti-sigma factor
MTGPDSSPRSRIAGPNLDLQVSHRLGAPMIYVKGELDHDTAGYLRDAVDQELTDGTPVLILEFSELAYMDSGGLSLMFDTVRRVQSGGWLGVVSANSGVARLLEITGLVEHPGLRVFPDLPAAADALSGSD